MSQATKTDQEVEDEVEDEADGITPTNTEINTTISTTGTDTIPDETNLINHTYHLKTKKIEMENVENNSRME